MNFEVAYPKAFYALLLLIPALLFTLSKFRSIIRVLTNHNNVYRSAESFKQFKIRFMLRTVFRVLAWIALVFAIAGISWGTKSVAVQKSGSSVAMVFDISYSMEARDTANGQTRLETAAEYAERLLGSMDGVSVSVTLAKGNATSVIPMTEDFESVKTLLKSLSPLLMQSEGSSLGSGIDAAAESFPSQSAASSYIWLFTDGEETDEQLSAALNRAAKNAIPVTIIGIGDATKESYVAAGDGFTKVATSLREDNIKAAIDSVQRKTTGSNNNNVIQSVTYINYASAGSAVRLLNSLNMYDNTPGEKPVTLAYEVQSVKRTNVFIILTIVFFAFSVFFGEFDVKLKKKTVKATGLLLVCSTMFMGCNSRFVDGVKLLDGQVSWTRANYSESVTDYLQLASEAKESGNQLIEDYAIYGLASTYLMQEESEAALNRYAEISENAPDSVKFGVLYNSGIIAHRRGDYEKATEFFKQALLVDSSNQNAKINLELSLEENSLRKTSAESEQAPAQQEESYGADYENSLYSLIRENELNQWKNRQQTEAGSAMDY